MAETTKGKGRGPSWAQDNGKLVKAFLEVSTSSKIATDRRKDDIWNEVHANFLQRNGSSCREVLHCRDQWKKIQRAVNVWVGLWKTVQSNPSSGANEADEIERCHKMFSAVHKDAFKYFV
ncbi:hypothetical protein AC1031_018845 [Aphanomyces cochlioides]|nr:hypothetical protein AC1031_018845 [Aphanomyces cochlioides]